MMYGFGLGASGGIFMILIVGLVIWLIVSAVRPERRTPTSTASPSTSRAIEVLADRYARGEIDGEEYRSRKAAIEGSI